MSFGNEEPLGYVTVTLEVRGPEMGLWMQALRFCFQKRQSPPDCSDGRLRVRETNEQQALRMSAMGRK
jgi:hypothetical protein